MTGHHSQGSQSLVVGLCRSFSLENPDASTYCDESGPVLGPGDVVLEETDGVSQGTNTLVGWVSDNREANRADRVAA